MKVMAESCVPNTDSPAAHQGILRPARKKSSVVELRREK